VKRCFKIGINLKKESKTILILKELFSISNGLFEVFLDPSKAFSTYRKFYPQNPNEFRHNLGSLKQRGYLKISHRNGIESIKFTNKAKMKLLGEIAAKREQENCFHFVSFDIPEAIRQKRDRFRRAIKQLGFIQIQNSLWVNDRNVGDLVELFAYDCRVEKYVVYLISQSTDIDGYILKRLRKRAFH
jgi:CRISPR-associated endonuclease Cas2